MLASMPKVGIRQPNTSRNAVTKDAFVKSLNAARKPLGALKSREVKSKQYQTSLPGRTDGQYVVIQFTTSMENKFGRRDRHADAR